MAYEAEQTTLEKLSNAIYGNGRDGLIERTVRIEDGLVHLEEETRKATLELKDFRVVITKELGEIKSLIIIHNIDKDLHTFQGLVFKKTVLIIILLAFIFLHSLIPSNINLWEIVKKIAGI